MNSSTSVGGVSSSFCVDVDIFGEFGNEDFGLSWNDVPKFLPTIDSRTLCVVTFGESKRFGKICGEMGHT